MGGLMGRTAVVCLICAATFGLSGVANASGAAASAAALPQKHIHAAKETRHAGQAQKNRSAAAARAARPGRHDGAKKVRFGGYAFKVPASWPVYRLGRDSTRCVRYDTNAVYLGTPGKNQQCPAHLVGQADTVSIAAPGAASRPGGPAVVLQSAAAGGAAARQRAVSVSATFGSHPGAVRRALRSLRYVRTGAPVTLRQSAPAPAAAPAPASAVRDSVLPPSAVPSSVVSPSVVPPTPASPSAADESTTGRSRPASPGVPSTSASAPPSGAPSEASPTTSPVPVPASPASPRPTPTASLTARTSVPMQGFDTCTAPSVDAMRAWRKSYSAVAIYIGGADMACGYGNLSASWVRTVRKMGWSLIPIYVGLQAPCNSFGQEIQPGHASSEGTSAADSAVLDAKSFGLGKGGPIYFDMEAYNSGSKSCRDSVLSFLDKWTRQLHARGYVSGVYSSAASGAEDLGTATSVYGRRLAKPDSLWFALWDNRANLIGTPYLLNSWWAPGRRIKQYEGSHWVKVDGVRLNVDSDWVQGAVY